MTKTYDAGYRAGHTAALADLATTAEIAEIFGTTVQVVSNWTARYPDFPAKVRYGLYLRSQVAAWYRHRWPRRQTPDLADRLLIAGWRGTADAMDLTGADAPYCPACEAGEPAP